MNTTKIRATDLGEFWTDRGELGADDALLCCTDPDGSDHEAVQPGSSAMDLMQEMARRYNVHAKLLAALRDARDCMHAGDALSALALINRAIAKAKDRSS